MPHDMYKDIPAALGKGSGSRSSTDDFVLYIQILMVLFGIGLPFFFVLGLASDIWHYFTGHYLF